MKFKENEQSKLTNDDLQTIFGINEDTFKQIISDQYSYVDTDDDQEDNDNSFFITYNEITYTLMYYQNDRNHSISDYVTIDTVWKVIETEQYFKITGSGSWSQIDSLGMEGLVKPKKISIVEWE